MPISDGTKPAKSSVYAVLAVGYISGIHIAFSTAASSRSWNAALRSSSVWAAFAARSRSSKPSGVVPDVLKKLSAENIVWNVIDGSGRDVIAEL